MYVHRYFFGLVLLLFYGSVSLAQKYEQYTGWSVPTTPELPQEEIHPSLYFRAEGIASLKERISDPDYAALWAHIDSDAIRFLEGLPSGSDESDRPRMAKTLAFSWLMNGSTIALQRSIEALLIAFDGVPKSGEGDYDEIYRATWLQNYCAAYDWVHDQLDAQQDSTIRARLADEANWLRRNLTEGERLAPRPHNHRSKPAWALGTAALTLSEHPDAADWLEYALMQLNTVTRYMFSEDGIYREGGHYWMFSAVNFIPFLWHYLNVSGVDLFPYYRPTFEWPVKIRMGQGWMPNHEDSYLKPAPTHMVARAYLNTGSDLNDTVSLGNVLQWSYDTTNLFERNYTGATNDVTWEIDEFILYDNTIEPIAPNIPPTLMMEGGQIVFRNRWQGGPGHRYLFFHGVPEADNHNHPDQLSFLLSANDAYLSADAGYGPQGFSDDRRNSWYIRAKAHNIITADFFPPRDAVPDSTAPTPYFFDSPFFDFAEKQSEYALPAGVNQRRAIAFVGENYWVVTDLMSGGQAATQFQQHLHARGVLTRDGHHATWVSPTDRFGPSQKLDAYLFPQSTTLTEETGYVSLFKDEKVTTFLTAAQTGADVGFMQILIPNSPSSLAPTVLDESTDDYLVASVTFSDTTDAYFLQSESQFRTLGAFATDGTFLWTRQIGADLTKLAFREMTVLDVDSQVSLSSDLPLTLAMDISASSRIAIFMTPIEYTASLDISWPGQAPVITEVRVNDTLAQYSQDETGLLTLQVTPDLTTSIHSVVDQIEPETFRLFGNYPNPFNAGTRLAYRISTPGIYTMTIYNLLGQAVRRLQTGFLRPDLYLVNWDGRDGAGQPVASGVFVAALKSSDTGAIQTTKMLLIK